MSKVEGELKERGVHTSLIEADMSRVDTFKNIEPEEPFSSYYSLFSLLKARKAIQRGYGTTFLLSNSQQEFCVYDKLEEMRERNIETGGLPPTMRFEHRLLNKQKIQNVYGFGKVEELFKGGYEVVKEKQVEQLGLKVQFYREKLKLRFTELLTVAIERRLKKSKERIEWRLNGREY